jgi:hypothetical protein
MTEKDGNLRMQPVRHKQKSGGVVELAGYYSTENFPLRAAIGTGE